MNGNGTFKVGDCLVEQDLDRISHGSEAVTVRPQVMEVLVYLASRSEHTVHADELLENLWPDKVVTSASIYNCITELRQAFQSCGSEQPYVDTIPKKGYRLIAPVERLDGPTAPTHQDVAAATLGIDKRRIDYAIVVGLFVAIVLLAYAFRAVPPHVASYRQITESPVIFPPFASPYPLVPGNSRLYFATFETGSMRIKKMSMAGGEIVDVDVPGQDGLVYRPTGTLPDGSGIVMLSWKPGTDELRMWEKPFVGGSLRGIGDGLDPVYSPDGRYLAFASNQMDLLVRDVAAGDVRTLAERVSSLVHWIRWSPDGRKLRYTSMNSPRSIWEVDVDGGEPRRVFPELADIYHCCGIWTQDGRFFVFQATRDKRTQLYAVTSSSDGRVVGEPVQITSGPLDMRRPTLAPDGNSLFAIGWQLRAEAVVLDPSSGEIRRVGGKEALPGEWFHFAADADRIAYVSYPEGNVWTSRADGSDRMQLTFDNFDAELPLVSPDGKLVAFWGSRTDEPWSTFVVPSTGGTPALISPETYPGGWSPDSTRLVYQATDADIIQVHDLVSGTTSELSGAEGLDNISWSPEGDYLLSWNAHEVSLYEFESGEIHALLEDRPLDSAYWGRDDSTVYVIDPQHLGADRGVYELDTRTGAERLITKMGYYTPTLGQWGFWVGVTPSGEPMYLRDLGIHHIYKIDWLGSGD